MASSGLISCTPCTMVNAAAATGVAAALVCSVPNSASDKDRTLVLSNIGVGAVPTAVTVDLEASADGGSTWQKYATGVALVTGGAATSQKVLNVVGGLLYRLNITTLTLGGASAVNILGTIN